MNSPTIRKFKPTQKIWTNKSINPRKFESTTLHCFISADLDNQVALLLSRSHDVVFLFFFCCFFCFCFCFCFCFLVWGFGWWLTVVVVLEVVVWWGYDLMIQWVGCGVGFVRLLVFFFSFLGVFLLGFSCFFVFASQSGILGVANSGGGVGGGSLVRLWFDGLVSWLWCWIC